jgi:hypothetical protein
MDHVLGCAADIIEGINCVLGNMRREKGLYSDLDKYIRLRCSYRPHCPAYLYFKYDEGNYRLTGWNKSTAFPPPVLRANFLYQNPAEDGVSTIAELNRVFRREALGN